MSQSRSQNKTQIEELLAEAEESLGVSFEKGAIEQYAKEMASRKAYQQSPKGRIARGRYQKSEKGEIARQKYMNEKGYAKQRDYHGKRYLAQRFAILLANEMIMPEELQKIKESNFDSAILKTIMAGKRLS